MEKFKELTGIPYDKVMVFPHSIAPEKTMGALKTYNYLATINSTNVPQDVSRPAALSFTLRPETLSFAGFPSIRRYPVSAPLPDSYIAINAFLGNPLLFYGHSEDFASGVGSFDIVADRVNKFEPDTQWRSLGDIVRHLYVIKLRDDSNYDVLAFSGEVCLDNQSGRDAIYYVRKQQIGGQTIQSVTVDGQNFEHQLQDGYLEFSLPIPMGKTRCAAIQYQNDLDLASIGIAKNSTIVYLLRMSSDFRDDYLSKTGIGLAFIRYYNDREVSPSKLLGFVLGFMALCIYGGYGLRSFVRTKRQS
jgi:hypothetical protein